jgi:hypothetical protein
LSTTNPTWIDPGANPGLRCERSAANDLSHGTAPTCMGYSGTIFFVIPATTRDVYSIELGKLFLCFEDWEDECPQFDARQNIQKYLYSLILAVILAID